MFGVEVLVVAAGHSYSLAPDDSVVAAAASLTVDGSALGVSDDLTFNGSAETNGTFHIIGGAGDNNVNGGSGADIIDLSLGGTDVVNGGSGDDTISMGAFFDAGDTINGGAGTNDTLYLDGDYSVGFTFGATTLTNIDKIVVAAGHDYRFVSDDATVAGGATLVVDAGALGASNTLRFNGGAEFASVGHYNFIGGAGNDSIAGGRGNDHFDLSLGGDDNVYGDIGVETYYMGAALTAADTINSGSQQGIIILDGDYSAGLAFAATTTTGEDLVFWAGHDYNITVHDGNAGGVFTRIVDGSLLGASDELIFNGSPESTYSFDITGGAGDDTLTGGAAADTFDLTQGGVDAAYGGGGNDTFTMGAAFTAADTIDGGAGASDGLTMVGGATVAFGAGTMSNVESLTVTSNAATSLTTDDATVASGATLNVTATAMTSAALTFNGAAETDGIFAINAGSGDDVLTGGSGNSGGLGDTFNLVNGGNDSAYGGGANDQFLLYGSLTAADTIDGGIGTDTLYLNGDYSGGFTFGASTITNIESIVLTAGHSYNFSSVDANVASGATMAVSAIALGSGNTLFFNASAETDGSLSLTGGAGNDTLTGGAQGDTFNLFAGGSDAAYGGGGNDLYNMNAALDAGDELNGGAGTGDTVSLSGDYSAGITFGTSTIGNIEQIQMSSGFSYNFTTAEGNVTAGQTLTVGAATLIVSNTLTFNGAAETDGHFTITGGAGDDTLTGGALADTFTLGGGTNTATGGGGADDITCGAGADTLVLAGVSESNSAAYDMIGGFNADADKFNLPVAVGSVSTASGSISAASFDADMGTVISDQICAVVTATGGDLIGHVFLFVDGLGGGGGYQAGADYIFDITGYTGTLDTGDFI
jgi:Ca2+-binding RTX toxin-like protein